MHPGVGREVLVVQFHRLQPEGQRLGIGVLHTDVESLPVPRRLTLAAQRGETLGGNLRCGHDQGRSRKRSQQCPVQEHVTTERMV